MRNSALAHSLPLALWTHTHNSTYTPHKGECGEERAGTWGRQVCRGGGGVVGSVSCDGRFESSRVASPKQGNAAASRRSSSHRSETYQIRQKHTGWRGTTTSEDKGTEASCPLRRVCVGLCRVLMLLLCVSLSLALRWFLLSVRCLVSFSPHSPVRPSPLRARPVSCRAR